ncbi:Protein Yip1-4-like [Babesia duncani]|uniref:Protein Yip1-4-like n=1 Tax=Babesia duncani TaxID=323732 RepID=A0AAD9UPB6_9APIC|nr:Protein Yip1-4-like [Babesia duncani]
MQRVTKLLKKLYRRHNGRRIELVADFELEFGLLKGDSNLLNLARIVYGEIYELSGLKLVEIASMNDLRDLASARGYGYLWDISCACFLGLFMLLFNVMNTEELLVDLLSVRLEHKRYLVDSIDTVASEHPSGDDYVLSSLLKYDLEIPNDLKIGLADIQVHARHEDLLFQSFNLDETLVNSLRQLSRILSDEYAQRWHLSMCRFDCLLGVFLECKKGGTCDGFGNLLQCIYQWKNAPSFRHFYIYDMYGAQRSLLKIHTTGRDVDVSRVKKMYQTISNCAQDVDLNCFIKRIQIPEPPNRGGIPNMLNTKGILKKVYGSKSVKSAPSIPTPFPQEVQNGASLDVSKASVPVPPIQLSGMKPPMGYSPNSQTSSSQFTGMNQQSTNSINDYLNSSPAAPQFPPQSQFPAAQQFAAATQFSGQAAQVGFHDAQYQSDPNIPPSGSMDPNVLHGTGAVPLNFSQASPRPLASAPFSHAWNGPFSLFSGNLGQQLTKFGQAYTQQELQDDNVEDPPFFEELGVDVQDIARHVEMVMLFKWSHADRLSYGDITGPVAILLLLGVMLLITGRVAFSVIYVTDVMGSLSMYLCLNLTSQDRFIDLCKVICILSYSLLPICLVPLVWVISSFAFTLFRHVLIHLLVLWSTVTAWHLLQRELGIDGRRKFLILYPTLLYYLFFTHLIIA